MTERGWSQALSVRQPWAWFLSHGFKDVENRDWKPRNPNLRFRGRFGLHASATMTSDFVDNLEFAYDTAIGQGFKIEHSIPELYHIIRSQRGGIVGEATLVEVVDVAPSPWFFGPLGLVVADAKPLPFVPLGGMLGFFKVRAFDAVP